MSDFNNALRDRMADEHPDLIGLADRSRAAGTRLRRRRRAGVTLGAAGGLAAAAVTAVVLTNALAGPQRAVDSPGFASAPAAAESGGVASSEAAPPCVMLMPSDGSGGVRELEDGEEFRVGDCLPYEPQHLPVALNLSGWTCDEPADDKTACTGPDRGLVTLTVRPGDRYDAWVGDPDKEGEALWVSPLHDNYFVSVEGRLGSTPLDDFIDGLTFKRTWKR